METDINASSVSGSTSQATLQTEKPAVATTMLSKQQQEAIALKKALEWELSLDSRDLRSHGWYHGSISRQRAEEIVQKEGDFLIRDCASQPDNYVLTCYSKGNVLHFVINKILLQPETVYERVQYQFEEDAFDAVPDLITFYVGSGKPVSAASGACIQFPCNRYYPLSFYGHKIVGNQLHTQLLAGQRGENTLKSPNSIENLSEKSVSFSSPNSKRRNIPPIPILPHKKPIPPISTPQNETNLQSSVRRLENAEDTTQITPPPKPPRLNGCQTIGRRINATEPLDNFELTTHSLPRSAIKILRNGINKMTLNPGGSHRNMTNEDDTFEEDIYAEVVEVAPVPPPRPPQLQQPPQLPYRGSGSDSGNGSGDSLPNDMNGDATLHRGVIIKNPCFLSQSASTATLKSLSEFDSAAVEAQLFTLELPEFKPQSRFDLENFNTLLLPLMDNKPLDGDALHAFKVTLLENGPRVIAEHLTRIDIGLLIGEDLETAQQEEKSLFDFCGLEMMTLPQGKIFRGDLIERTQCLKLLVAVTVLTCHSDMDRAEIISRWIEIAVETKTALGNLFGFCAIMLGLSMPQIQKLEKAWHLLRQTFTDNAFTFEAKLRPIFISMNECSNPQAPNTTVPHVVPYCLLLDRPLIDLLTFNQLTGKQSLSNICVNSWETKESDYGMTISYLHLDAIRNSLQNLHMLRKNSKLLLEESSSRMDVLISDAFRTEFHIKFLWGSAGAQASVEDRITKLEKVLTLMADKFASIEETTNS